MTAVTENRLDERLVRRLVGRVVSSTGETADTVAPFTGERLAAVPVSSTEDVATAFAKARVAQQAWSSTSARKRAEVLLRYHDLVLDRQDGLLDLIQWESGKARKHAFEEIADLAVTARYYARRGPGFLRPKRRAGLLPGLTKTHELHHPKGVVGVISPWNYPLWLAMTDALAAVLAGNAIVLKPDAQTPLIALAGIELLHEAGLPENLWQVVCGPGPVIGGAIIDLADYVCFTGSTATGRTVAERAAKRLVGCSLELGGKNPMLVFEDADLDRAAEGAVRACFSSAGQLCISIERIYLAGGIREEFLGKFLQRVHGMRLSNGFEFDADMGSLVSARQLARVTRHVDDAVARGATVLAGGTGRPDLGPYFFEPTVLTDVTPDMALFAEETFGPVVSVYGFDDEVQAVALANRTRYGLNASVWTRDQDRAARVAARIRAGTVNVNEGYAAAYGSLDSPMGGMGESGLGRRHGREGLLRFTETQTVAVQRLQGLGTPPGFTDERWARTLGGTLRTLKKVGWR
ncbi:MAG TPA: succinic semialdehyde dehydrogenase [Pseudonocardiaceae bacterium]